MDRALEYLEEALKILEAIRKEELPKLVDVAREATERSRAGGKLVSHIIWGHMLVDETRPDRPGQPGVLPQWGWDARDRYSELCEGDAALTNEVHREVKEARERGTYIAGFSVPYLPNKFAPPGTLVTQEDPEILSVEEVSDVVLYCHVPYENGLVRFPEVPYVPVCPGSAVAQVSFYWMASAEVAYRLSDGELGRSPAGEYISVAMERVRRAEENLQVIREAASEMAERVVRGGRFWVYQKGRALVGEACGRASGLMAPKPLDRKAWKAGDVVVVGAELPDEPEDLDVVREARDLGAYSVAIGPEGETLSSADAALRDFGWEGVVEVPGYPRPVCPTSGLINAVLLWMLTAQFVEEMIKRGEVPAVYMGIHLKGGREHNEKMKELFERRGY